MPSALTHGDYVFLQQFVYLLNQTSYITATIAKKPQVTANNEIISFDVHFHQTAKLTCESASAPIRIAEVGVIAVIRPEAAWKADTITLPST